MRRTKIHGILWIMILLWGGILLTGCNAAPLGTQTASANAPMLLYEDDFTDPTSGWEVSSQGGLKDYYQGTYHIKINDPNIFSWSVIQQTYGDVSIQVEVAFTGAAEMAEMGLICRMQNNQDFYFFMLRSDGAFAVFKMYQGNEIFIGMEGYQFSDAIHTGLNTNEIGAECKGQELSLSANGTHLITVEDSSYQVGDVGVIAGAFDQTDVNVYFDNFSVMQP